MNFTNQTKIQSLDYWYNFYGVTILIDVIFMYLLTPVSVLAFFLNLISFYILSKNRFAKLIFYSYLKLYIINSTLISLFLTTVFTCNTYRFSSFTNSFEALAYGSYILTPVMCVLYFYSTLLEICIALERSLNFFPAKYRFKQKNKQLQQRLLTFVYFQRSH